MRSILGLALILAALAPAACDDTTTNPEPGPYLEPTSPENLVQNLVTAYERKETGEYAKILAQDFVFKFQPVDVIELNIDKWTRDQDITGTAALFENLLVGDIRISLTHARSTVSGESFPGVEGEVRTIRVNPTRFLFEWRDLPDPSGTGAKPGTASSTGPAAVEDATWGRIKTLFR